MKYLVTIVAFIALLGLGFATVHAPAFDWQAFRAALSINIAPAEPIETRALFVGDIMMDRSIRIRAEREPNGYTTFFECAAPTFREYDTVVANLEGSVTTFPSVSRYGLIDTPESFRFTMSSDILPVLRDVGIDAVGVDNNHVYDFGRAGLDMTRQLVPASGLVYFGDPADETYMSATLPGFHIVTFNEFIGTNDEALAKTLEQIARFAAADEPVVVFAHWGNEYVPATERVKTWARQFIDAGADAVIGHHPHVTQETEYYNGAFIAYSLGNFVFDQYFDAEVRKGGAVELIIRDNAIVEARLLPVTLDEKRRPCIGDVRI